MNSINKCRVCRGKLKFALKMKRMVFLFCEVCTLLQRADDVPYELDFNFEGRQFVLPYYPAFLENKNLSWVSEDSCVFFSLKAIEFILNIMGYTVTNAVIKEETLAVSFDKATSLEKIRTYEQLKRLDNKYTYFLYAIQQKKEEK